MNAKISNPLILRCILGLIFTLVFYAMAISIAGGGDILGFDRCRE
jgi:hypothetical protein